MRNIPDTLCLLLAAAAGLLLPIAAQAQAAAPALAATASAAAGQGQCAALAVSSTGGALPGKAEALLGGQQSKLDLLRRQQGAALAGTGGERPGPTAPTLACARLALPQSNDAIARPGLGGGLPRGQDFLASRRLPVSRTNFDGQWQRVLAATLPRSAVANFAGLSPSGDGERLLSAVNAYANHRIRYVEDRALYGQADYWADARTTLARGAGDCEDIAIAKLQLLAAAGVPRSDMYLTIARDPVRKADHAVLVVRLGERFWLLDNTADRVVDAAPSYDYRPIFSFSANGRWLHGA